VTPKEGPPGIESRACGVLMSAVDCAIGAARRLLVTGRPRHGALRADLEEAVQIPVVEPAQAAVVMATGRIRLREGSSLARQ
jgi:hypothetical protein